jgi:hypothetical protein
MCIRHAITKPHRQACTSSTGLVKAYYRGTAACKRTRMHGKVQ